MMPNVTLCGRLCNEFDTCQIVGCIAISKTTELFVFMLFNYLNRHHFRSQSFIHGRSVNGDIIIAIFAAVDMSTALVQLVLIEFTWVNFFDGALSALFLLPQSGILVNIPHNGFTSRCFCIVQLLIGFSLIPTLTGSPPMSTSTEFPSYCSLIIFAAISTRLLVSFACGIYLILSFFPIGETVANAAQSQPLGVPLLHYSGVTLENATDVDDDELDEIMEAMPSPGEKFSLSFSWMTHIFTMAQTKTLQQEDCPTLPRRCRCKPNGEMLRQAWGEAYGGKGGSEDPSRGPPQSPSHITAAATVTPPTTPHGVSDNKGDRRDLFFAIMAIYGAEYAFAGLYLAASVLLSFLGPIFLERLVTCAEEQRPLRVVGWYIFLLYTSRVLMAVMSTQYSYLVAQVGISVAAAVKSCVFRKVLRLSTQSRRSYTAGNISNFYTIDIERVVGVSMALHSFWSLPLQIMLAMVLLYYEVSLAMFAGLGAIVVLLTANNYIAHLQKRANDLVMKSKDERMKHIGEVFHSILTVKLNVWEDKYVQLLHLLLYSMPYSICLN